MLPINNHEACSITPILLPPAHAAGAERGVTVKSRCTQNSFVDVIPSDDPQTERCQALWRAVIGQQIADAKNISHKPEKQLLKSRALDWLFHNEYDFAMACDLAGWEPDYVYSLCVRAESDDFRRCIVRSRKESRHA